MQPCRIKICGITRIEDALDAARLGVDAIGLVFYEPSPRAVTIEQARQIIQALPPFVTSVGLFVDATADHIAQVLAEVPLDSLQFHGNESPAACAAFARPYIKAVRMNPAVKLADVCERYAAAQGLLLDTDVPGVAGGTGLAFDWTQVPVGLKKPIIVAGGLTAQNVGQAIATLRPYAVDVSGGVETETKGVKSAARMAEFVAAVRSVTGG